MLKVVVFGAGGFLGEHIVDALVRSNISVFAAVRTKPQTITTYSQNITYCEGDLEDCDYIRQTVKGMDAIVFAAGGIWKPDLPISEYERCNVQITKNFFEALGDRPDLRIIFTSSMTTIAGSDDFYVFSETSDRSHVNEKVLSPYDQAKIECEQIALDYAKRGNNVVILNPGNMLGPGISNYSKITTSSLVLWICTNQLPFYINGGHTYCDVRDVAATYVNALTKGHSGERYILGGHNLDRTEITCLISQITGLPSPKKIPVYFAYWLSNLLRVLSYFLPNLVKNSYHPTFIRSFSLYYYGNSQKAIDELAYTIRAIDTTILDTVKYFCDCDLIPRSLLFLKNLNSSCEVKKFLLLRQLVKHHQFCEYLLLNISKVYHVCTSNQSLKSTLDWLVQNSRFNCATGYFTFNKSQYKEKLEIFNQFFDYLYFASDDFLSKIL